MAPQLVLLIEISQFLYLHRERLIYNLLHYNQSFRLFFCRAREHSAISLIFHFIRAPSTIERFMIYLNCICIVCAHVGIFSSTHNVHYWIVRKWDTQSVSKTPNELADLFLANDSRHSLFSHMLKPTIDTLPARATTTRSIHLSPLIIMDGTPSRCRARNWTFLRTRCDHFENKSKQISQKFSLFFFQPVVVVMNVHTTAPPSKESMRSWSNEAMHQVAAKAAAWKCSYWLIHRFFFRRRAATSRREFTEWNFKSRASSPSFLH